MRSINNTNKLSEEELKQLSQKQADVVFFMMERLKARDMEIERLRQCLQSMVTYFEGDKDLAAQSRINWAKGLLESHKHSVEIINNRDAFEIPPTKP